MTTPTLEPDEVVVGLNNGPGLYIAPVGTAGPATLDADWESPWVALGYISNDGATLGASTDTEQLTPWQSVGPIRTIVTARQLTMQFVLWQTNENSLALYFDMAAPTPDGDGNLDFDIESDSGGQLWAVGIDIKDGDSVLRVTYGRASLSAAGDVTVARGSAIGWDVTLSALDDDGVLGHVLFGIPAGS